MSTSKRLLVILVFMLLGASIGAGTGLLCGLAYTQVASTSDFEGYSGFVAVFWMLAGLILGSIIGAILGRKYKRT